VRGTEPQDFRVRAYMVLSNFEFLRQKHGDEKFARVLETFSPETQHILRAAKQADWCPLASYSEVLRAVADMGNGKDELAREILITSGQFVAREATNTFLRLLMKMLTPPLFAKKLPDFWKRDCTRGRLEVDVSTERLAVRMLEMKGLDHAVCAGAGFVKFALESMGKSVQNVTIHNWSLTNPCAEDSWFEFTWSN
jgi:hypothetical protein